MTYGWIIMVALVTAGSLSYFKVLNLDNFLTDKCSVSAGIACLDFNVETSRTILVLKNNLRGDITINKIDIAKINGGSCSDTESKSLKNNQKVIFTILGCNNGNVGEKFRGDINVAYTKEGVLSYTAKGSITAKIVTSSTKISSNICQKAEESDLCDGLDILFGIGYKASCCSGHGLCCS